MSQEPELNLKRRRMDHVVEGPGIGRIIVVLWLLLAGGTIGWVLHRLFGS